MSELRHSVKWVVLCFNKAAVRVTAALPIYKVSIFVFFYKIVFKVYIAYHAVKLGHIAQLVCGVVVYFTAVAEKNFLFRVFEHKTSCHYLVCKAVVQTSVACEGLHGEKIYICVHAAYKFLCLRTHTAGAVFRV